LVVSGGLKRKILINGWEKKEMTGRTEEHKQEGEEGKIQQKIERIRKEELTKIH